MVGRLQTVEDGWPREEPEVNTLFAGTIFEERYVSCGVRVKGMRQVIIIHASKATGIIALSIEDKL